MRISFIALAVSCSEAAQASIAGCHLLSELTCIVQARGHRRWAAGAERPPQPAQAITQREGGSQAAADEQAPSKLPHAVVMDLPQPAAWPTREHKHVKCLRLQWHAWQPFTHNLFHFVGGAAWGRFTHDLPRARARLQCRPRGCACPQSGALQGAPRLSVLLRPLRHTVVRTGSQAAPRQARCSPAGLHEAAPA